VPCSNVCDMLCVIKNITRTSKEVILFFRWQFFSVCVTNESVDVKCPSIRFAFIFVGMCL